MSGADYRAQFDLAGRVAVVTGGGGMLGREFCKGLVQCGAHVAVIDIDKEKAESVAEEIEHLGDVKVLPVSADISDPDSARGAVTTIVSRLGGIDVLVNNAQSFTQDPARYFAPFEEYDVEEWRRVLSVDLDGMAIMAQQVCAAMATGDSDGSLVQIGSIYGEYGPDMRIYEGAEYQGVAVNNPAVYSVGKAGVLGLTRWLAAAYGAKGIRANTVVPGGVESGQNDRLVRQYANRVPMGRMARKEEIVGAVLWLASPASSYVTGQHVYVDGGLSAW